MKPVLFILMLLASVMSYASLPTQTHTVTENDCLQSEAVIMGAITARDEVDYETVVAVLGRPEHQKIEGLKAMLPMTKKYLKRVFFEDMTNTDEFWRACTAKIGTQIPRQI